MWMHDVWTSEDHKKCQTYRFRHSASCSNETWSSSSPCSRKYTYKVSHWTFGNQRKIQSWTPCLTWHLLAIKSKHYVFSGNFKSPTCPFSIVNPTRCTNVAIYFIFETHPTCFGRSLRPSSGDHDCTYRNRHISNRTADCMLASSQRSVPDDGRKDRPKYVQCFSNRK